MVNKLFDQFTYLHFAVGIVSYFWGFGLITFLIYHTVYEIFETTDVGRNFINKYFSSIWPGGGKNKTELGMNAVGDTIGALIGWMSAYYLDRMGNKLNWYELHIK